MKTLLVAINAKYIHPNLALGYLKKYAQARGDFQIDTAEYTINHRVETIFQDIYRQKPQLLIFSTYIWNVAYVQEIVSEYKKVAPNTVIILGGPEVSFHSQEVLAQYPHVDMVMTGEGEETFFQLMKHFHAEGLPLHQISSLAFRGKDGSVMQTPKAAPLSMDTLPFPYEKDSLPSDKILYYESSRGCPFRCSYCLSSVDKTVRELPLPRVFSELLFFLQNNVRQVKFVDRTFNCSPQRALAIWQFIGEHDNGITNFHFEISANLLTEEQLAFLKTVRPGLFQFEIGVQSTNPQTLAAINRKVDMDKLFSVARQVRSFGNIHQHLDLIAGLPFEGLSSFATSFNQVFSLLPQQLQLGFLKVLKGAIIYDDIHRYGIVSQSRPPYEVLYTQWLSYEEVLLLHDVEEMVELYYNSGRFSHILSHLLGQFSSPFVFFDRLGSYFRRGGYQNQNHRKEALYEILFSFMEAEGQPFTSVEKELCLLDICLHEKPKKLPFFLEGETDTAHKKEIAAFFTPENIKKHLPHYQDEDPKRVAKLVHIQLFSHGVDATPSSPPVALLFDYSRRNIDGNAVYLPISLI